MAGELDLNLSQPLPVTPAAAVVGVSVISNASGSFEKLNKETHFKQS